MGIKSLSSFLLTMIDIVTKVSLSTLTGYTIAVDWANLMHRFLYRNNDNNAYLLEFINFIHKCQKYQIDLIFVFDGRPCEAKQYTINQRRHARELIESKIADAKLAVVNNSDNSDNSEQAISHPPLIGAASDLFGHA